MLLMFLCPEGLLFQRPLCTCCADRVGAAPMVRVVLSGRSEQLNNAAGNQTQRIVVYTASIHGYSGAW
jgi:hypothetical protein